MTIYKNIDVITWFTIASVFLSIAFSNHIGIISFGAASLWCLVQDFTYKNDKYHVHLLNVAGLLFASNAVFNAYQAWGNDNVFASAQMLTFCGSLISIAGNTLVDKMKRDVNFLKSFQSAITTTLANPAFWYAINIIIIGVVALLMNTLTQVAWLSYVFIILATIAGILSITSSTKRMMMAKHGEINVQDINDGLSNMWIARSNAFSLVVIMIGLISSGDWHFVPFAAAQSMFIYGHYIIAKTINPEILFIKLLREYTD